MDYNNLRATSLRLIQNFGNLGQAQITTTTPVAYDPITDTDPGQTVVTTAVDCVVLPAGDAEKGAKYNDLSITYSLVMYLPSTFAPTVGDLVTIPQQPDAFTIVSFKTTAPDGFPIYSKCRLERTAQG